MEKDFVQAFAESGRQVLNAIAGVRPEVRKFEGDRDFDIFVTGILSLKGDVRTSVSLSFSKDAIHGIYLRMFPGEEKEITFSGLIDLVGEISNMVSGRARDSLSDAGVKFHSSIPRIIFGEPKYSFNSREMNAKIVHLIFDGDLLFVDIKDNPQGNRGNGS